MSREDEVKSPRFFDRRVVERNIKKGLLTRKDYEKFLKALEDSKDNIAPPHPLPDGTDDDDRAAG